MLLLLVWTFFCYAKGALVHVGPKGVTIEAGMWTFLDIENWFTTVEVLHNVSAMDFSFMANDALNQTSSFSSLCSSHIEEANGSVAWRIRCEDVDDDESNPEISVIFGETMGAIVGTTINGITFRDLTSAGESSVDDPSPSSNHDENRASEQDVEKISGNLSGAQELTAETGPLRSRCIDMRWVDSDGSDCLVYESYGIDSCGLAASFIIDGVDARTACCFCGGGIRKEPPSHVTTEDTSVAAAVETTEVDQISPQEIGDSDEDLGNGSQEALQNDSHGNSPHSVQSDPCILMPEWRDTHDRSCEDYVSENLCEGSNNGDFATNGISAEEACCALCNGVPSNLDESANLVAESSDAQMHAESGSDGGAKTEDGGSVGSELDVQVGDNDAQSHAEGEPDVTDEIESEGDTGTEPGKLTVQISEHGDGGWEDHNVLTGSTQSSPSESTNSRADVDSKCVDYEWVDSANQGCDLYELWDYCGLSSNVDYAVGSIDGDKACCVCGGGISGSGQLKPSQASNSDSVRLRVIEINSQLYAVQLYLTNDSFCYIEYEPRDLSRRRLRSPTSPKGSEHMIYLYRLYANTQYVFYVYTPTNIVFVHAGTFTTGDTPIELLRRRITPTYGISSFSFSLLTLKNPPMAYIYDQEGEIVWWIPLERLANFAWVDRKRNFNLVVAPGEAEVYEITPWGEKVNYISLDCTLLHHGMSFGEGETTVWSLSKTVLDVAGIPQLVDTAVEIDQRSGTFSEPIKVTDWIDTDDRTKHSDDLLPVYHYLPCLNSDDRIPDWTHGESISLLNDTLLVLGLRHLDAIIAFQKTESKKWEKLWQFGGKSSDFHFEYPDDRFYGAHFGHLLDETHILAFDNGYGRPEEQGGDYSRAIEYELDYDSKLARVVWQHSWKIDTMACYTCCRGSVKRLTNGNTFVQYGQCSRDDHSWFLEVNKAGEIQSIVKQLNLDENLITVPILSNTVAGEFVEPHN